MPLKVPSKELKGNRYKEEEREITIDFLIILLVSNISVYKEMKLSLLTIHLNNTNQQFTEALILTSRYMKCQLMPSDWCQHILIKSPLLETFALKVGEKNQLIARYIPITATNNMKP